MHAALPPGRLAENVVHFARILRAAGLPLGTDRVHLALRALALGGVGARADVHDMLLACLLDRAEQRPLFDLAFDWFWRDPDLLGRMLALLLPTVGARIDRGLHGRNRRLDLALRAPATAAPPPAADAVPQLEALAAGTWSDRERLRKADFETMTPQEWRAARRLIAELQPFLATVRSRRHAPAARGRRVDLPAALRLAARSGGDLPGLPRREPRTRPEPLVAIIDISGSVSAYSRAFLHFLHALANADGPVEAFVFGTRLTRITRLLRGRDPDVALAAVVAAVDDWSGGTRIAQCLEQFLRQWSRRIAPGSRTVLLMSDGLERGDGSALAQQAAHLARSCRRVVWLNPLLRYAAFEPRAQGVRALLPHVERMLPIHNVESLAQLPGVLARAGTRPGPRERTWK